jgi:putative component of membrane protein insertase Oxa1/YidC/SpoIIIJ protein YidD
MIDDWPGRWPYRLFIILTALLLFSLSAVIAQADEIGPLSASHPSETPTWSSPLLFFQRVISRADGDRCPMYPSCSHYAATVFKRFNPVTAWILTCDRLLRCGHDETRTAPQVLVNGAPHAYDPVEANTFWWRDP